MPNNPPPGFVRPPLEISRSNSRFTNLPVYSFNVGFNYERKLGRLFDGLGDWADQPVTGFVYSNVAWQDKSLVTDPYAVFQYWQPAYALVNAGFGVRTDDDRYSLNVWAKNLTNQRPLISPGDFAINPGTATAPATYNFYRFPQAIGGTFRIKFY